MVRVESGPPSPLRWQFDGARLSCSRECPHISVARYVACIAEAERAGIWASRPCTQVASTYRHTRVAGKTHHSQAELSPPDVSFDGCSLSLPSSDACLGTDARLAAGVPSLRWGRRGGTIHVNVHESVRYGSRDR